jgi:hypothetical protein
MAQRCLLRLEAPRLQGVAEYGAWTVQLGKLCDPQIPIVAQIAEQTPMPSKRPLFFCLQASTASKLDQSLARVVAASMLRTVLGTLVGRPLRVLAATTPIAVRPSGSPVPPPPPQHRRPLIARNHKRSCGWCGRVRRDDRCSTCPANVADAWGRGLPMCSWRTRVQSPHENLSRFAFRLFGCFESASLERRSIISSLVGRGHLVGHAA